MEFVIEPTAGAAITVTQNAVGPDPMLIIGGIALGVALIVLIIGANLISKAMKQQPAAPAAATAPVSFAPQAAQGTDPQLIAVITAALVAYMGQSGSGPLRVRSIKRADAPSAWATAGRQDQIRF